MALIDPDGLTRAGYGGSPQLTDWGVIESGLAGIGQTESGGYLGKTAIDAVKQYKDAGHTDAETMSYARSIGAQHGRRF